MKRHHDSSAVGCAVKHPPRAAGLEIHKCGGKYANLRMEPDRIMRLHRTTVVRTSSTGSSERGMHEFS